MNRKYKILIFCAHPDDAELCAGGTIKKLIDKGNEVRVIIMTNGNVGVNNMDKDETSKIRKMESIQSANYAGYDVQFENINDGEIFNDLSTRRIIVGEIRKYSPDIIFTHRSNDYHPDHRYTSILVQDSLVLICSQKYCPEITALNYTPITLFFWDRFIKPNKFSPDIIVDITNYFGSKIKMLSYHKSQFSSIEESEKELQHINDKLIESCNIIGNNDNKYEAFEICEYAKENEILEFDKIKFEIFK